MIIPNATMTVLRSDAAVDENDDPVDTDTVVAADLPACITPKSERTYDPASGQVTVIDKFMIDFRPGAFAFTERDRVKDQLTGDVYQVESVRQSGARLMQNAIQLTCSIVR